MSDERDILTSACVYERAYSRPRPSSYARRNIYIYNAEKIKLIGSTYRLPGRECSDQFHTDARDALLLGTCAAAASMKDPASSRYPTRIRGKDSISSLA